MFPLFRIFIEYECRIDELRWDDTHNIMMLLLWEQMTALNLNINIDDFTLDINICDK